MVPVRASAQWLFLEELGILDTNKQELIAFREGKSKSFSPPYS